MIRCIFFDRDGTLGALRDNRFPTPFTPYCDISAVFSALKARGFFVGILSNQSSIARGTGGNYDFDAEFSSYGADVWEICPHDTQDNCDCRKPQSGLLLRACAKLHISPQECIFVGDRLTDVMCAKNAGAQAALVLTGSGEKYLSATLEAYPDTPVLQRFDEILNLL